MINLEKTLNAILEILREMKESSADLKEGQRALEEGQNALRRDISRVERKIDKQGNDIADTLWYMTNNVDNELGKLKEAK